METAIYARGSTEEQAQEQKLKDYAKVKDWSIYLTLHFITSSPKKNSTI